MAEMTQKERLMFLYNQGIRMAGTGYYKTVDAAFDSLKTFKPFTRLNLGNEGNFTSDFTAFSIGFNKVQNLRIRIMKMKAQAEAELKEVLAGIEGKF